MKLTSKDIEWKEGMNFAVVTIDGLIVEQYKREDSKGTDEHGFINFGISGFSQEFYYVVERELPAAAFVIPPVVEAVDVFESNWPTRVCGKWFFTMGYILSHGDIGIACTADEFNKCVKEMTGDPAEHRAWLTALNDMRKEEKSKNTIESIFPRGDKVAWKNGDKVNVAGWIPTYIYQCQASYDSGLSILMDSSSGDFVVADTSSLSKSETEAQKKGRERDLAIKEACKVIESAVMYKNANKNIDCSFAMKVVIESLIDAGYKLPGADDE